MQPKLVLLYIFCVFGPHLVACIQSSPEALASQYSLTTSTTLPFPTATQASADAQTFLVSDWSLSKGRVQDGPADLAFVADPFPQSTSTSSNSTSVLQVTYPAGSFSHDTGGTQFYNLWNTSDGSSFLSMVVSYEVAFDKSFDWVKGGKLPGLRGGNATGCSGGDEATGLDCFSSRLMWRPDGAGEVYAYIPTPNKLCDEKTITCNSDFGTSISRGSFTFPSGQWSTVTLLVQLNSAPDVANGNLQLYFNNLQVASQGDLQFRASSGVTIGGMYFSTFFGGSDDSWATPATVHTYFRNIRMWGSASPSNLTGAKVVNAATPGYVPTGQFWTIILLLATSLLVVSTGDLLR